MHHSYQTITEKFLPRKSDPKNAGNIKFLSKNCFSTIKFRIFEHLNSSNSNYNQHHYCSAQKNERTLYFLYPFIVKRKYSSADCNFYFLNTLEHALYIVNRTWVSCILHLFPWGQVTKQIFRSSNSYLLSASSPNSTPSKGGCLCFAQKHECNPPAGGNLHSKIKQLSFMRVVLFYLGARARN